MLEPNFDIDRLGMLTLQHFESGVESDSSCCDYSSSDTSSSNSPVCSPTDLEVPFFKLWRSNEGKEETDQSDGAETLKGNSHEQSTCRYRRGCRGKETVSKRNERERRRVRQISEGFSSLRKSLMIQPRHRKLPKLQILRRAISYIKNLEDMLRESDRQNAGVENQFVVCHTSAPQIQANNLHKTSPYTTSQTGNMQANYSESSPATYDIKNQHQPHLIENSWIQGRL